MLLHSGQTEHVKEAIAANLAHTWEDLIPKSVAMLGHDLPLPSYRHLCFRDLLVKWRGGLGFDGGAPLYSVSS